jgi:hypothetical protein
VNGRIIATDSTAEQMRNGDEDVMASADGREL